VRYLVLVWFCALAMVAYIHRNAITVPAKRIAGELEISDEQLGFVLGMFFWGYSVFQIPGGWLSARFGSRAVVPVLIIVWSACNSLMALATGPEFLLACRFTMGMAQAGLFACAVQSFGRWFPPSERAMPSGYLAAFMSVGGAIASGLTGLLLVHIDWQTLMFLYGLPGIVCAIWFFWWFRDHPTEHARVNAAELGVIREAAPVHALGASENAAAPDAPWWTPFLTREMILLCLQQFCRAAAYIFYGTWFPTFLQESRGVSEEVSGYLTMLPLLGVVLGSAVGGQMMDWVYRRTGSLNWSRRGLAMINLFTATGLMLLAFAFQDVLFTMTCLTLGSVCAGACGPAGYTMTIDLGGKQVATVFSVMNMSGNIGAAIFPLAVVPIRDEFGWDSTLILSGALYLAAGLCWMWMRMPGACPTPVGSSGR
jgi:MFS family permease